MNNKHRRERRGVVLLIALAMLGLFSILIISYVISTGQVAAIAELEQSREILPTEVNLEEGIGALVYGSQNPHSAAYGQSLFDDLYGSDGYILRVGHDRSGSQLLADASGYDGRGFLLDPNLQLFKVPTNLAPWHRDGGAFLSTPVATPAPMALMNYEDALAGRQITFLEGPLTNQTFQVIRSFNNLATTNPIEKNLRGSLIIDLSQYAGTEVEYDGVTYDVMVTASSGPGVLLYDPGNDTKPGSAGIDDNRNGSVDDPTELGWPGTDDYGFRFVLNGLPFNGLGRNPRGISGIARAPSLTIDRNADIELQYNSRLIGGSVGTFNAGSGFKRPEPDEPWDAADFENLYLAWQPSDHRSAKDVGIYGGGSDLDRDIGSEIIPSFHRPEVINYLLNQKIFPVPGPAAKSFWETNNLQDLAAVATRLRRATMRPLNFGHDWGDLDGDGSAIDGNPGFTGSNPALTNLATISRNNSASNLKLQILQLSRWLANGPWDVDNDGDAIPDSIWLDLQLPHFTTSSGAVVRPLIAPLIEDLDGKINLNESGNYRHLFAQRYRPSNPNTYSSDAQYLAVQNSLRRYGFGSGVGPAEIDFSHIFDQGRSSPPPGFFGPIYRTQTSSPQLFPSFLYTRFGNLLNTRYGGSPIDYSTPPGALTHDDFYLPGAGKWSLPDRDLLGEIPYPAREAFFSTSNSVMGKSMDMFGIATERRDRYGNELVVNDVTSLYQQQNELVNQPYEFGFADDKTFQAGDLAALIDKTSGSSELRNLLADEIERNRILQNLITTDSQTIDVPEVSGAVSIMHAFASRLTVPATDIQLHLDRMLAPEFRKGTKLNLNRQLGNGRPDAGDPTVVDELMEVGARDSNGGGSVATHEIEASEPAFRSHPVHSDIIANYNTPISRTDWPQLDFNGIDTDGNGTIDVGNDVDGDNLPDKIADGQELLARHLYCLMFLLIKDGDSSTWGDEEWVPNFPYPAGMIDPSQTDVLDEKKQRREIRNRFVAKRIAQWATNAVDYRDTDARCTRLRYDPNPFDGFDLSDAAKNVVWGTERPELEISETLAFHDKRIRRNLEKSRDQNDESITPDGELPADTDDDPDDDIRADSDMDQFRIPEASSFVELRSLRSPLNPDLQDQSPRLPRGLYTSDNKLDLGRIVGNGNQRSPVWRLAIGEAVRGDLKKSIRWMYDADRVARKLAKDRNNEEQINYLSLNAPDWTNGGEIDAALVQWAEAERIAAEVRHSRSNAGEYVTLSDTNFDPTDDSASNDSRISLKRFVWFSTLKPNASLNVINNPASGMKLGNVFYNTTTNIPNFQTAQPKLSPGQFTVIAPRLSTVLGQQVSALNPPCEYAPSSQKLEFALQADTTNRFRFNYMGLVTGETKPLTPKYYADGISENGKRVNYHVKSVLPIVAKSVLPHEAASDPLNLSPHLVEWRDYAENTPANRQVALGFNISAPLAGEKYYQAPTQRIFDGNDEGSYPLKDGYRNYNPGNEVGFHPDVPFDHLGLDGNGNNASVLAENDWAGVGTYQEAVGVFLQRLADPTSPWHPIDNPYLTMDLAPMDLTTLNGEGDVTEEIDRRGTGDLEIADSIATTVQANEFVPKVKFDSRRKIPDTSRDRAGTNLVQKVSGPNDLTNYKRELVTQRSALSSSFSILRDSSESATGAIWKFPLGAMWTKELTPNDAGINSNYDYDAAWSPYHPTMDLPNKPYRQTLGFINREYGRPIGADNNGVDGIDIAYGRGTPRGTLFMMPQWDDRDFQSKVDLLHIPASARTGLNITFTPGTRLEDDGKRELPATFSHLLGFDHNFASENGAADRFNVDVQDVPEAASYDTNTQKHSFTEELTGKRAPFELVLDYVNTGEPKYSSNHWFDEQAIKFKKNPTNPRQQTFNRVVEFMQPPYNYVSTLRSPGRINLNTVPDYIRHGGQFNLSTGPSAGEFLDFEEKPDDNREESYNPGARTFTNSIMPDVASKSPAWDISKIFGNGTVFRSLAWAGSSYYDLDTNWGSPTTLGQYDYYNTSVDTSYGRGFKAFIESRRGYDTAMQSRLASNPKLNNPNLDWRYPTRFAGVFSTASAAQIPSIQRFMGRRTEYNDGVSNNSKVRRRTHDMTLVRPHPDFDPRLFDNSNKVQFKNASDTRRFSLYVETDPTDDSVTLPPIEGGASQETNERVGNLRMTRDRHGVFERSLPDLHKDFNQRARNASARWENASRMTNLTTNHSNVFMVRLTVGFFLVDPESGALGSEYADSDGVVQRGRATYVIDRSKPAGFIPGEKLNWENTVLYENLD